MEERYFYWLCELSGIKNDPDYSFFELLRLLHSRQFYYILPTDENRALDGKGLRMRFERQTGVHISQEEPCSVLEMMLALAGRMAYSAEDDSGMDYTSVFFLQLICNLRLLFCTDSAYLCGEWSREYVDEIVNILLDRRYSAKGEGGLFPLPWVDYDVRKLDIWYQMQRWMAANCTLEEDEDD